MGASFGYIIPQRGSMFGLGSLPDLLDRGRQAEESGLFDALWVGDSLTSKARPEALVCLGALAATTQRVRLAVGCMASFPIRDPALFAYQWATLDELSQGRMLLSVCSGLQAGGASAREGEHFGGVPDKERTARMEENLDLVRQLWTGEPIDFEGRFHEYHDIQILPTPVQASCPVWITANPKPGPYWERSLRRIATRADGWMTIYPGSAFPDMVGEVQGYWDEAKREAPLEVALYHNVNISHSHEAGLDETRRFMDDYYGAGAMPEALIQNMTTTGTVDDCIAGLRELVAQGATHLALRSTSYDQAGQFRRLVDEVLPEVQAAELTPR